MGNGNISGAFIHLNQTKKCYLTGDIISGTVGLNLIQAKRDVDKTYIVELIGEIGYTTTETYSYGKGRTTITKYHHPKFYKKTVNLTTPNVERDIYYWPFQFQVPNHLPPTINKRQNYPHVKYYLQLSMYKEDSKSKNKVMKYLTKIYPRINLLENLECLKPIHIKYNEKNIILHVTLNKSGYVPGEVIYMTLQIENPRKALVQRIDLSMIKKYIIQQCTCKDMIFKITLPKILNLKDEQIQEVFDIRIPSLLLPPSYVSHEGFRQNASIDISYKLELAIKIQGFFNDFYVDIPITLGTDPNPDYSMFNDDDLPPDYDSAVQNLKRLGVPD